jgi:hypothetical protein
MKREFVYVHEFDKNWKAMNLTDDDLTENEKKAIYIAIREFRFELAIKEEKDEN